MRVTAIPAQVTTVEDRIVGNLNLTQLLLLCTPVFIGGLLYAMFPPLLTIAVYKLLILAVLAIVCGLFAVRIKGMIVFHWAAILFRFVLRPRYYVFDKHSMRGRKQYILATSEAVDDEKTKKPAAVREMPSLSFEEMIKVRELISNPSVKVAFETRKGGLYVRVTEAQQEG